MKSKFTAYVLWFFLGAFGAHRFYTGNIGTGLLWLFTLGLFGIGVILDLFLTAGLVDTANMKWRLMNQSNQGINININNGGSQESTTIAK